MTLSLEALPTKPPAIPLRPPPFLQASIAIQEPLLSVRRQLADILGLSHEAGLSWLQYARLCRSTGESQRVQMRANG